MEEITIFADSIDDITPSSDGKQVELTLIGVDIKSLLNEFQIEDILEHFNLDEIKEYLKDRDNGQAT